MCGGSLGLRGRQRDSVNQSKTFKRKTCPRSWFISSSEVPRVPRPVSWFAGAMRRVPVFLVLVCCFYKTAVSRRTSFTQPQQVHLSFGGKRDVPVFSFSFFKGEDIFAAEHYSVFRFFFVLRRQVCLVIVTGLGGFGKCLDIFMSGLPLSQKYSNQHI